MGRHPNEQRLIELAEGIGAAEDRGHLQGCAACRAQVDELRAVLSELRAVEVPEPSPLYWDTLRARVARRLAEPQPPASRFGAWLVPALVAAAVVLVGFFVPHASSPPGPQALPSVAVVLPAWSPLPAVEEDDAWLVLQALASTGGLASLEQCRDLAECAAELGEHDAEGLARALQAGAGGGKS
jgi:hypothetical protein